MSRAQNQEVVVGDDDTVIALMGPTGTGKSTFIERATRQDGQTIGHDLMSKTFDIRTVRVPHRNRSGKYVCFVDTPGFDDSKRSDYDILASIAMFMIQRHKASKSKLTGIIYAHRISDNRMAGSTLKQLHIFADLCGEEGLPHVVLMTTMWSTVHQDVGLERVKQLKSHNDLWLPVLNLGATTSRFDNSYDSAWDIVEALEKMRDHRIKVQLPKEMVDDKLQLKETRSAITLQEELKKLVDAEEAANRKLRDMVTQHGDNELVVSSLNKQRDEIIKKIEELTAEMRKLNIPILRRFRKLFKKRTNSVY